MRKIKSEHENPIDDILIGFMDHFMEIFKSLQFTPNDLTTLSFVFGLVAVYFLYNNSVLFFAIYYIVSYLFDIADGHYARKYQMTSTFGDLYDHVTDIIVFVLIIYTLYAKYNIAQHKIVCILLVLSVFLMLVHLSCQENIYTKKSTMSFSGLRVLCRNPEKWIYTTKYFGVGTFMTIVICSTIYLKYHNTQNMKTTNFLNL